MAEVPARLRAGTDAGDNVEAVYEPLHSSAPGDGLTPKEAAALVVANRPPDCGPAYDAVTPAQQPKHLSSPGCSRVSAVA